MVRYAGVHGLRPRGWIVVTIEDDHLHELSYRAELEAMLEAVDGAERIGVDLLLAHDDPDGSLRNGLRTFDVAARETLGADAGRVDPWPPDILFDARDHEAAVAEATSLGWPAPTRLQWQVRPKVLQLRRLVARGDARFMEVHPEVAFQRLATTHPERDRVRYSKTTMAGIAERLELLHGVGLRPARSFGGIGGIEPKPIVDATVCAWAAREADRHAYDRS